MGRSRQCTGKIQHPTRRAARAHANALRCHQLATRMDTYRCTYCGFWHVGHFKRRRR